METYETWGDITNFKYNVVHVYDIINKDDVKSLKILIDNDNTVYAQLKRFIFYSLFVGSHLCSIHIIERLEDVNENFFMDNTYIQAATEFNRFEIAKILLERGADPNVITTNFICPLSNAVMHRNSEMVDELIKHGASIYFLIFFLDDVSDYGDEKLTMRVIDCMTIEHLYIAKKFIDGPYLEEKIHECWKNLNEKLPEFVVNYIKKYII